MSLKPDLTILPGGRGDAMAWRPLGQPDDLDLAFDGFDRPLTVTLVLHACAEPPVGVEAVWSLSLAARIGGLLAIWSAGQGAEWVELGLTCPVRTCGAAMEAQVPVQALLDLARTAEATPEIRVQGLPDLLTMRRPTGADQRLWRSTALRDVNATILGSLVVAGDWPKVPEVQAMLEDALAEFDPLPCFSLAVQCPDCGAGAEVAVDVEAEMLTRLARMQGRLFHEVDILARRYGWTDQVILSMPPLRRARYLAMAAEERGS